MSKKELPTLSAKCAERDRPSHAGAFGRLKADATRSLGLGIVDKYDVGFPVAPKEGQFLAVG